MAVESVVIINNYGKARLATFYRPISTARQQLLIRTIYHLVSNRPDEGLCNFLDAPQLKALLQPPASSSKASSTTPGIDNDYRVIYRHYATLCFIFVVDSAESDLAILDLIQVFVESLDRFFPNVCELDLIFHYDEVQSILSQLIQGGLVLETNINEIVKQAQAASKARKASASSTQLPQGAASVVSGNGFQVGINAATTAAGWARDWMSTRR
ncbi:Adaptor protein complex sigma subunit [Jaminaea rosea]|uniref:AP complex subunit sigma n=1 Tax=Jaminaea rosea TaxID=1569628 RepID=A0A316UPI6_9BASI|nr:Adaptor protein complex sigma subunit [Jaminaea rosea]PWN26884.1 Adaptor protein complex sigma subunit [Jaminaea rosea]